MQTQTYAQSSQTETGRQTDRQRLTARQRQTTTDRGRQRQTETDRQTQPDGLSRRQPTSHLDTKSEMETCAMDIACSEGCLVDTVYSDECQGRAIDAEDRHQTKSMFT